MVEHHPHENRFVIEQDGHVCILEYIVSGDSVNFTHTYVPFRLRGKGFAEMLVKEGLAWADANALKKQASCWYVAKFLDSPSI